MLVAWLQQKDDVVEKALPTWKILETALKDIKEHEIADIILRIHTVLLLLTVVPLKFGH